MKTRRAIADFYSSEAGAYKELWAPELLPLARALLPALPLQGATRILEAGAGVGELLPEVQRDASGATVIGTDVAEGMIALAPREFPRAVMDATQLGFRESTFDVGILAFVLFHISEPEAALAEMHRVVAPGGVIATITWGLTPGYAALDIWNEELESHGAAPTGAIARHELVDTPDKIDALLKSAGLSPERIWTSLYDKQMSQDEFLEHRIGHGTSRCRYESLEPEARNTCVEAVRRRLRGLGPEGLRDRQEVIYAIAHR
jgi:SAM-dependent methyltransferase